MKKKDFYTGLIMLILSGTILVLILRSPSVSDSSGPGPFFLPAIVALVIAGLSIALLVQSSKGPEPASKAPREKRMWNRILWIMIWCFGYAITIERLGYLLSTGIVTFALLAYFNRRKWLLNIFFSLITPASIYILFDTLLKIPLPKGWFGF
jgi:putative tricarboxylic transport membrane protein